MATRLAGYDENVILLAAVNLVKTARVRAGLTQEELARMSGVDQAMIARIERDRAKPRIDTVMRLLRACGFRLEAVPREGIGIDRTTIRQMLALTPSQRLQVATKEARNLERLRRRR